jgi:photosystem II stability/assembly factor-like uncharacterized protein
MKKLTFLFLIISLSFYASAQLFTFDWEEQQINEGYNMKEMNVVSDNMAVLVGYGRTFETSTDQGETWKHVPILRPVFNYEDISINSSGLGYACARDEKVIDNPSSSIEIDIYADGLLLKTTDFGATWAVVDITEIGAGLDHTMNPNVIGCYARHFRSVEVLEDNTVFLGIEWYFNNAAINDRESYATVFKTTDGIVWNNITSDNKYPMGIEAATTNIYFGGSNHLYRAETGSEVVTDIFPNLSAADGDDPTMFVYDFTIVSEDLVYVTTATNGIFVTEDQGATFTELGSGAPAGGNDMFVVNDTVMLVLGTGTKSKITRDSGATWVDCYPGAICYEIGGIMNDTLIALAKSDIYKIEVADLVDGAPFNWVSQTLTDNSNLQKMHITDANNAIIAGYGESLFATSDAGLSWNAIDMPELFVYGAGYDWSSVSTLNGASYAVSRRIYAIDYPSESDYADVYGSGLIVTSIDNWQTWEMLDAANIGTGTDPALNPNAEGALGLSPETVECINETTAYTFVRWIDSIAGYDVRTSHANVFKTEDGGDSWLPIFDDLGTGYITSIQFDDIDNGYIMGNTFLRKTEDGGETFIDMYPALQTTGSPDDPTLYIKQLEIVDENKWYVLSSTDGIFVTEDGGSSYSELSGIGGGSGIMQLDETSVIVLGQALKSKLSWDNGQTWNICYPGSVVWAIGGIMDDKLVALAKGSIYKIPLSDLAPPSEETDIVTFELDEQTGDATIDAVNHTITIEVATGTDPTALTPTITVSEGAKISLASDVEQDFSDPVTYTVTAEDLETDQDWIVTVTIEVGIEEMTIEDIRLYPNPVKEKLYLDNIDLVESISIFSITGSQVLHMETASGDISIDMSTIEEGVYFISFMDIEGGVSTKKLVKTK